MMSSRLSVTRATVHRGKLSCSAQRQAHTCAFARLFLLMLTNLRRCILVRGGLLYEFFCVDPSRHTGQEIVMPQSAICYIKKKKSAGYRQRLTSWVEFYPNPD